MSGCEPGQHPCPLPQLTKTSYMGWGCRQAGRRAGRRGQGHWVGTQGVDSMGQAPPHPGCWPWMQLPTGSAMGPTCAAPNWSAWTPWVRAEAGPQSVWGLPLSCGWCAGGVCMCVWGGVSCQGVRSWESAGVEGRKGGDMCSTAHPGPCVVHGCPHCTLHGAKPCPFLLGQPIPSSYPCLPAQPWPTCIAYCLGCS